MFDLKTRKQRRIVAVTLHAGTVFGHHVVHELVGLVKDIVGVDQYLANVSRKIVANGTNHQAGFLVN